jgi:addiction module HigA family antidote
MIQNFKTQEAEGSGMRDYTTFETPLPHPGETLREDFLPDYGLSAGALAKAMGLKNRTRIERVVREQQPITPDTALRLGRVFGTTPDLWMNLQTAHDLSKAALAGREALAAITPLRVTA